MDFFVHSSGPFGGPFSDWGGGGGGGGGVLQSPENPPWLRPCYSPRKYLSSPLSLYIIGFESKVTFGIFPYKFNGESNICEG